MDMYIQELQKRYDELLQKRTDLEAELSDVKGQMAGIEVAANTYNEVIQRLQAEQATALETAEPVLEVEGE